MFEFNLGIKLYNFGGSACDEPDCDIGLSDTLSVHSQEGGWGGGGGGLSGLFSSLTVSLHQSHLVFSL